MHMHVLFSMCWQVCARIACSMVSSKCSSRKQYISLHMLASFLLMFGAAAAEQKKVRCNWERQKQTRVNSAGLQHTAFHFTWKEFTFSRKIYRNLNGRAWHNSATVPSHFSFEKMPRLTYCGKQGRSCKMHVCPTNRKIEMICSWVKWVMRLQRCEDHTSLSIPPSFRAFGESSFLELLDYQRPGWLGARRPEGPGQGGLGDRPQRWQGWCEGQEEGGEKTERVMVVEKKTGSAGGCGIRKVRLGPFFKLWGLVGKLVWVLF